MEASRSPRGRADVEVHTRETVGIGLLCREQRGDGVGEPNLALGAGLYVLKGIEDLWGQQIPSDDGQIRGRLQEARFFHHTHDLGYGVAYSPMVYYAQTGDRLFWDLPHGDDAALILGRRPASYFRWWERRSRLGRREGTRRRARRPPGLWLSARRGRCRAAVSGKRSLCRPSPISRSFASGWRHPLCAPGSAPDRGILSK